MGNDGHRTTHLVPQVLTDEAFAPYGWRPRPDTDPEDGRHRLVFEWGDPHVNLIGHTLEEVPHRPGALVCTELFHHRTHTQVLMAMDHPCVIVVAPAEASLDPGAGLEGVMAFRLQPFQPLVLHQATWHWGPYPSAADRVTLFNVQGFGYAQDNERLDLDELGVALEVDVSAG